MIHANSVPDTVSQLSDIVHQLSSKVEKLEAALAAATATARTGTSLRPRSSTLAILARMNDEVLPSMNMDAFLAYLARMPCDAECVVNKNSAEVLADLVIDGRRSLCAQYSAKSTVFIPPIANVSINDSSKTTCMCIFDSTESKWITCTADMFSIFARRVHSCVVAQCDRWREKNVGPPLSFYCDAEPPKTVRDPRAMAMHQKITAKIYSLNLGSVGLMARTKKLVGGACVLRLS